jgi:hypothetical protein
MLFFQTLLPMQKHWNSWSPVRNRMRFLGTCHVVHFLALYFDKLHSSLLIRIEKCFMYIISIGNYTVRELMIQCTNTIRCIKLILYCNTFVLLYGNVIHNMHIEFSWDLNWVTFTITHQPWIVKLMKNMKTYKTDCPVPNLLKLTKYIVFC